MGSLVRMNRCGRFIEQMNAPLREKYQKYEYQKGDWWEMIDFNLGQAEDGTEVVKLYLTLQNKRTGDQHIFCHDECLFEPESEDHHNVDRLASELCDDMADTEGYQKALEKAAKLLKKADLIQPNYSTEEEVA